MGKHEALTALDRVLSEGDMTDAYSVVRDFIEQAAERRADLLIANAAQPIRQIRLALMTCDPATLAKEIRVLQLKAQGYERIAKEMGDGFTNAEVFDRAAFRIILETNDLLAELGD